MPDLSEALPSSLRRQTRYVHLAGVPALIAHPDWTTPAPVMLWMHGRTANKELDPGRYLRWIRAGIAAVALDLPGHGERRQPGMESAARTLDVVRQMIDEIDPVVAALRGLGTPLDLARLGIGGMSAGGMATLRRLCDPHPFTCAAIEATCGDFEAMYQDRPASSEVSGPWEAPGSHDAAVLAELNPARRLATWRPVPLLALHSETDQWVPFAAQRNFIDRLCDHYREQGADPALVELKTWASTGAPFEHAGFGKFGPQAKDVQVEFLVRHLRPQVPFGE